MKKTVITIMILALLFVFPCEVHADNNNLSSANLSLCSQLDDIDEIVFELQRQMDYWLLNNDTDITSQTENFYIGDPIYSYEFFGNRIVKTNISYLPVFLGNDLEYMVILIETPTGHSVQLTSCLVKELCAYSGNVPIALLYDSDASYLVSRDCIQLLHINSISIESRGSLLSSNGIDCSRFELTALCPKFKLDYHFSLPSRTYTSVPVAYVSQDPPSNICWAASAACIGNYLTTQNFTAHQLAVWTYGIYLWDSKATMATTMGVLNGNYFLNYSYSSDSTAPTDTRMYNNFTAGYPMLGFWRVFISADEILYHMTVLAGIDSGSYVYVMDPEYGFTMATFASNAYTYVSAYSNHTLTLIGYGSML